MAVQFTEVGVTADLTVLVPRDADGGLEVGTANLLERIEGVEVETVRVTGLRPRLNDLAVQAEVDLSIAVEDDTDGEAVARERLADGFGVTVEAVTAES